VEVFVFVTLRTYRVTYFSNKKYSTPSDRYYLSLVWMYLDTKMCPDTSTLADR
jgi:hypothetical protein